MLLYAGVIEVFHFKRLREVLSQKVRGSRLQRFPVAHHRLDRIGEVRAGEFFRIRFCAGDHWNRGIVHRRISGSANSSPPPIVTTASSGENPSTWCFSFSMKLFGISSGNATFW